MIYRNILYSNSKLLTLYFIGTFLALLFIAFLQQSWYKFAESEFFEKYFIEQAEIDSEVTDEEIIISESTAPKKQKNEFIIDDGDTLASIFNDSGISTENSTKIINAITKIFNPKKLKVGTIINLNRTSDAKQEVFVPEKINIRISAREDIEVIKQEENYLAKIKIIPVIKHIAHVTLTINNSLIASAMKADLPYHLIMSMVKAYSYDIDFQRDIKSGNKLDLLIDKYYTTDGKFSHVGSILYACLFLNDKKSEIFQFTDASGDNIYYNQDAVSVVRQLLRTPINAARMSSGFGTRIHPVHGYSKMHKGVDFAAPVGTPILAAGNGVVELIGRKGGYGKYIRIKHSDTYSTAYAHLRNFSKDIVKGSKIKQGQVIGYVGMTGITTGPHLHFEVLKMNKQINPAKLKLAPEIKLNGKELQKFQTAKANIVELLKKISPQSEAAG